MAEEEDVADASPAGTTSAADSIALAGASRAKADAYLDERGAWPACKART